MKNWDDHVEDLEQMAASAGFCALRDQIIDAAQLGPEDRVLDVGAGTGLLALAAAPQVAWVSALDVSPAMCHRLADRFRERGIENAEVLVNTAAELPLHDGTLDVVLSNYCFHHLSDRDKDRALAEIRSPNVSVSSARVCLTWIASVGRPSPLCGLRPARNSCLPR